MARVKHRRKGEMWRVKDGESEGEKEGEEAETKMGAITGRNMVRDGERGTER